MTHPDISVVVVTWNGWPMLERCLDSIEGQQPGSHAIETIVVDNGSTDETEQELASRYPQVVYTRFEENHGFAVANNHGVGLARAQLILLLNNDTVLEPRAVAALFDAAVETQEIDVFAPQMLQMGQPDLVDNRGLYIDSAGHCRQLDSGVPASTARSQSEVFGASGGACLIRRSMIDQIGLFDESLENYKEDCDLAFRARATGHRCLYVPAARILHVGSATARRIPNRKLYLIQRNMLIIRRRWLPFRPWRSVSWLGLAYETYQVLKSISLGRLLLVVHSKWDAIHLRSPAEKWATPETRRCVLQWVGKKSWSCKRPHAR